MLHHPGAADQPIYVRFVGTHAEYDQIDRLFETNYLEIRPIKSAADYAAAAAEVERLMDAKPGTPDGDRLDVLATLIQAYEDAHWPIDPPDPIDAIRFRMEQAGLTRRNLEPYIGSKGRVSEVLNRQRPLPSP